MIEILSDITVAFFAIVGLVFIVNEASKINKKKMKVGKIIATVYFTEKADKAEVIRSLLQDRRFEHIIKVPAENLTDRDRTELGSFIDCGCVHIID